jgi:hypothetical protein
MQARIRLRLPPWPDQPTQYNYNVRVQPRRSHHVHELTSLTVDTEQMKALYNFGQFQYTYSNYSGAADYIYHFRVLFTDNDLNTSAHWGIGFAESVNILFKQIIQAR